MILQKLRSKLLRDGKLKFAFTTVLLTVATLPGIGSTLTPQFPDISIVKGTTAAGNPYMTGGYSSDDQRLMERTARRYNLKLIFARRTGIPTTPTFVIIGANDGRGIEKIPLRAPWFYIQLPAGTYTILAHFPNQQVLLVTDVFIQEGRQRWLLLRGD